MEEIKPQPATGTSMQEKCKKCGNPVILNYYFCPNCGKKLKEPPFRFSWSSAIGLMLFSVILPPLGIFPGIKYLRMKDHKAKILGILYIILTLIASAVMIYIIVDYINTLNETINQIYQIQGYY